MSCLRTRLRRIASIVLLTSACCVAASPASAQFGGQAGFAEAFQPDFLARDVPLFVNSLALEDWQQPIVETLLADYQVSFASGIEGLKQRMSSMKDQLKSQDESEIMRTVLQPIDTWSQEKLRLRDEFLENVRSQLSDQQLERWPRFERAFRREKTLDRGELQGESVNLLRIVRELQLSPRLQSEIEIVTDEYELKLDNALVHRQQVIESQQAKVKDAMTTGNQAAGLSAMDTIMNARVVVRRTQDEGRIMIRHSLESIVDAEVAAQFEDMALRRGYPKVYRTDPILPLFDNVRNIETLTPEQHAAINDLEARYVVEIASVNETLADAYREEEPKEPRRRMAFQEARQAGSEALAKLRAEPDAVSRARALREETYERYRQALIAILNEEQKQEMPQYGAKREDGVPMDPMEREQRAKDTAQLASDAAQTRTGAAPRIMERGVDGEGKLRDRQPSIGTSAPPATPGRNPRGAPPRQRVD